MKKTFDLLKSNPLFQDIAFHDFDQMLNCLSARTVNYKKNDIILLSGDTIHFVGLILSGTIQIVKEDLNGHRTILTELSISDAFGETLACAGITQSPVTIMASTDSEVLFIDYRRVITTCSSACPFHAKLIKNMIGLIANKNLILNQKIDILSKRTTREKLLLFFDIQRGASKKFTIPFTREELANYLCVDRSAMSNELGKMRDDGLIKFYKNSFEIC